MYDIWDELDRQRTKVTGIVQVGAHHGQEHHLFRIFNVPLIYFEPQPAAFARLRDAVGDEATLVQCALGRREDMVTMHVDAENDGASSSVLKPTLHLQQYPGISFPGRVQVRQRRLDDCLAEHAGLGKFNVLVMDVQGYELEVLAGAEALLRDALLVITEVNTERLYENCVVLDELDDYMCARGFKRRETRLTSFGWGDAVYLKTP